MADNYLERKMEEYRHSVSSRKSMHRPVYGVRPGTVVLPYPAKNIVVIGSVTDVAVKTLIQTFRRADCRVAFCDNHVSEGNRLSQMTGSRFYPCSVDVVAEFCRMAERIEHDFSHTDVWVACGHESMMALSEIADLLHDKNVICVSYDCNDDGNNRLQDSNSIILASDYPDESSLSALSHLCLFLTMPGSESIRNQNISIVNR